LAKPGHLPAARFGPWEAALPGASKILRCCYGEPQHSYVSEGDFAQQDVVEFRARRILAAQTWVVWAVDVPTGSVAELNRYLNRFPALVFPLQTDLAYLPTAHGLAEPIGACKARVPVGGPSAEA
jgi:hypothetical protein